MVKVKIQTLSNIRFRNFEPQDAQPMVDLQACCLAICKDTGQFEPGFWFSPGFESGKNIFIAKNEEGKLLGYAATNSAYYSNTLDARVFWIDLRSDPKLDQDLSKTWLTTSLIFSRYFSARPGNASNGSVS